MRVATIFLLLPAICNAKAWQLLHSLDSGKTFTERGTVSLDLNEDGQVDIKLDHADNCLDLEAVNSLSSTGLYQIKLVKDSNEILTSVPACQVRRANFRDELSVTLNANADAVSLSYTPLVSPLAPKCSDYDQLMEAPTFVTSISYETATRGMTIPTLLPQTKPPVGLKFFPRSQGAQSLPGVKAPDEQSTPTSFMMKYWYIIAPLFVMAFLNTGGDDTAAAPAADAAGPAVAASAVKGSPTKARRGKRS